MPQIEDFKGLPRDEKTNLIKYPTEILGRSLSRMMKDSGPEKYAVLAHGPNSCVSAMYLASFFPKQVTHLVLINPSSAGTEYSMAIATVRKEGGRRKNQEIVKGADSISLQSDNKPKYKASDSAEQGGLNRALNNLYFGEAAAPEVGMINFLYKLPGGSGLINDSTWSVRKIFKNQKPKIPVMVVIGENDPWAPVPDVMKVVGFFDHPYLAKFPNSSETPFMTDTYAFTQHMEKFFGSVVKGAAAKADKTAKTGKTKVGEKSEKKPEAKKEEKKEEPPETEPEEKPGDEPGDKPDDPDDPDKG
jgi:pimeloyl-ACP methyl ester carboxylesterase